MTPATDRYRNVHFTGAAPAPPHRRLRTIRRAPSPSIFAQPFAPHAPVISPADRLLLDDIFRRHQLNGAAYRPGALARRIPACLRALAARSPAEAQRRLEQDPAALELALNALLIGVTAFFRDLPVFQHLRATALPDLLCSSPAPRILSLGCSDGSELYSLAICLKELHVDAWDLRGVDCRRGAIERARAAAYPLAALDNLSDQQIARHFDSRHRAFHLKPDLRRNITFHHADAIIHVPAPACDLIACRNFAIYLEHPAAAHLWRRLHASLRPGGLLLTGKAEHPTAGFFRVGPCLFRKAAP